MAVTPRLAAADKTRLTGPLRIFSAAQRIAARGTGCRSRLQPGVVDGAVRGNAATDNPEVTRVSTGSRGRRSTGSCSDGAGGGGRRSQRFGLWMDQCVA